MQELLRSSTAGALVIKPGTPVMTYVPVPVNRMVSAGPVAGVIVTVAVRAPSEVFAGENTTPIMQFARPAIANPRDPPQFCVKIKSLAFVPSREMPLTKTLELFKLVR